ncbi:hypothetical protein ES332_A03G040000v1 [Gossypium tomentosum]|uniref:Uncharacterized protein n=1 Tax=Gossypium tomentosum TaxID=34277 RepID=A0A5D2R3F1_GOSTO|nr:hypothetical protein ES332_A03G040000v1 [Gossypium tomentosum]
MGLCMGWGRFRLKWAWDYLGFYNYISAYCFLLLSNRYTDNFNSIENYIHFMPRNYSDHNCTLHFNSLNMDSVFVLNQGTLVCFLYPLQHYL